ncbi:hypothetical protein ACFFS2_04395 [Streptomyces aurantiacus]|uniref:Uncharacterized protein n=1 Tax=Streptomyces aurantiacus TaxID=47760 RepID=A0A7G1P6H2_9ACTN|nr:hypothetical protein [Streptomyces aurantiacus]BCL28655.1 hypothetical protein GCM10017557_35140 [Streptomyces aurantiacus]
MRTGTTATMTVGLLLVVLTVCGNSDHEGKSVETPETKEFSRAPAYTVMNKIEISGAGSVDLVIPTATADSAKSAIYDYAKTIDGPLNYGINVIRNKADNGIEDDVCHGEWVKDEQAAQVHMGGRVTSDTWPAIGMYCSGPKG